LLLPTCFCLWESDTQLSSVTVTHGKWQLFLCKAVRCPEFSHFRHFCQLISWFLSLKQNFHSKHCCFTPILRIMLMTMCSILLFRPAAVSHCVCLRLNRQTSYPRKRWATATVGHYNGGVWIIKHSNGHSDGARATFSCCLSRQTDGRGDGVALGWRPTQCP